LASGAGQDFAGIERRAAHRRPAALWASCRTADDGPRRWRVQVHDLSPYGVGLTADYPFEPGTLLRLEIEGHDLVVIHTVQARVVHLQGQESAGRRQESAGRLGGTTWLIGCAFAAELDDATLQALRAERVRPSGPDARRWVRFPCDVETACYTWDAVPGERRPARILNVSPGGVGLLLPCEFAEGTLLYLDLPGEVGGPVRKVLVRVVRVSDHGHTGWFLGCEFAGRITADELAALLGPG
jgi:hypothetical protein